MGKLTFYGFDPSPPCRAVKLTLAALQLPYDYVVLVPNSKDQKLEELLKKKNPQHTVPMLEDDDAIIWDSHAIITYLVSKYGKDDSLYPKDLLKRAVVDQRLHFENGVVFISTLRAITRLVLFMGQKEVPKERIDAFIEVYDFMEAFLKDNDYVAGNQLTVADFSLISTISSSQAYVEIESSKWPRLSAWVKRMEELPYYSENSNGAKLFIAKVKTATFTVAA
ncbi:hypothetical protein KR215_008681 [Drosophila sulfurigaster]|nr:hypothetical protein KR215_008681 [Drosophila sulfurigaster]